MRVHVSTCRHCRLSLKIHVHMKCINYHVFCLILERVQTEEEEEEEEEEEGEGRRKGWSQKRRSQFLDQRKSHSLQ